MPIQSRDRLAKERKICTRWTILKNAAWDYSENRLPELKRVSVDMGMPESEVNTRMIQKKKKRGYARYYEGTGF